MEIKKTYEYSVYKRMNLSLEFKDKEEYDLIIRKLRQIGEGAEDTHITFDEFCRMLASSLEAPCS